MDRTSADYLAAAKVALGNPHMSDRELGEKLGGYSQPQIGNAKAGKMSDPMALKVAAVLPDTEAGEVLMVARLEREKDPAVKAALIVWASKMLAATPRIAAARNVVVGGVAAVVVVAGGALPSPSQASETVGSVHYVKRRWGAAANQALFHRAA
jgi:hypothetical protein